MGLLLRRWRDDAIAGWREFASPDWLNAVMTDFDWETRSRVQDGPDQGEGLVVVIDRQTPDGSVVRIEASSSTGEVAALLEWGVLFSRATGSVAAQVWRRQGLGAGLPGLGFEMIRPFWRMDRLDLESIPTLPSPEGYRLISEDSEPQPSEVWVDVYNQSFSEHFNHAPMTPEQFDKRHRASPDLLLMAVTDSGRPAAVVWGTIEGLVEEDPRPGPLGIIGVVGTLAEHRGRGLAAHLVADCLRRFQNRGARSASLHVDGLNPSRAYDIYRRLGFEIAWEMEVWEARFG